MKTPFNYALMLACAMNSAGPDKRFILRTLKNQQSSKNRRSPSAAGKNHNGFTGRMRFFGQTVYLNKVKES